ncbi:MAG: hypothetical protein FWD87_04970 [Spirochaetaceae bacterium]|nr:hypothetical protein [Spirochaetaceae bacterium]
MQKNTKTNKIISYFTILILTIFLLSCSENAPEINQIFWQITKFHDVENNVFYDRLSVFLDVFDEDGVEDIKTIYIINDREELFWKINEETWVFRTINNENWFGSNNITMHDFSGFPFGQYRVIVIDDVGERAETTFTISSYDRSFNLSAFPSAVIENNAISFSGNTDALWFYNQDMRFMSEVNVGGRDNRTAAFPGNANTLFLYRYDRVSGYGLMTGPFRADPR